MKREWKPGDVAMIPFVRGEVRAIYGANGWLVCDTPKVEGSRGFMNVRPLAVIDPEDREQVERLVEVVGYGGNKVSFATRMQAALREFADPKPEVLRHYIAVGGETVRSVCGKVWKPTDNVTVIGDCETCAEIVSKGWMA